MRPAAYDTTVPATNETDLIRAQIERLERLHGAEPLTLAVRGGGLDEDKSLVPSSALIISRDEVFCVLNRLRAALATREHLGW